MDMIIMTCVKKELEAIVDELKDWEQGGDLHLLLSGVTNKAGHGFILIRWRGPLPELFLKKMAEDRDFLDYVVVDSDVFQPPV